MDSARSRQEKKDLKLCEHIVKTLSADGPQRVVLIGESGIGKTQLARKVGEHATKKGLCYLALWLHLNYKFEDEASLYENIAFQIEAYDREEEEDRSLASMLKDWKEKISTELSRKKRSAEEKMKKSLTENSVHKFSEGEKEHTSSAVMVPYLLLVLDDEGNQTREDEVMKDLGLGSFLKHELNLKVLITRREGDGNTTACDDEIESHDITGEKEIKPDDTDRSQDTESEDEPHDTRGEEGTEADADTKFHGEIEFHTTDESQALHETLTKDHLHDLFESLIKDEAKHLLESLQKDCKIDEPLMSCVVQKSMSLPAAVVVFANSLNCITNTSKSFSPKVKEVLKEVLFPTDPAAYTKSGSDSAIEPCQYNPILNLAYALLELDNAPKNAIVDCFWHSLDFFKYCGCVSYDELITQWILEGYFDPVRSVKKAYKDGHDILLMLINRGILKIQEGDMIVPEMAMNNLIDLRHHGHLGRSRVRFARAYSCKKNKGRGKVTQIDDMLKTMHSERGYKVCTFLVSGNRLRREVPQLFFKRMRDLELLGLFNPTVNPLIPVLTNLEKLLVLVIRDCDLLSDIEELKGLRLLGVLEVSGASSVKAISDDFFLAVPNLQSLNLSGLGIRTSPSSISQLEKLHTLILRDCPVLEELPDIQNLKKLEVVDVRGALMLKTCFGVNENTSRNRTFGHLQQLQLLDFSESKIRRLPIFHDGAVGDKLHSLKRLLLHSCSNLIRLPNLKPLAGLQILDLSGTTSLVEITEVCFEQKKELKIINLSGTKITKLPSIIFGLSNLSQLLLRDNSDLEALPDIKGLTSLEIFDVSGCTKLQTIEGSFADMSYLREVNLSGTRIEILPGLPEKSSICCLKLVVLADSKRVKHDTWSQVKKAIINGMSESLSSSDTIDIIQEISRKESGKVDVLWAFDCPEKKVGRREHFHKGQIYRDVYMNTIPFVDTKTCQEVLEIHGSNGVDEDKETLAKVEFVAFVDYSAASFSSIFNHLKSVKGCWLEMCWDIEILFSDVDEERFENLDTLSITNFGRLESISSSSFKSLKQLSLDCCPRIKTLFPDSALPTSLEVLKIKFCEKLEKVFEEEVELPNLHTLCLFELRVLSTIGAKLPNLVTYKYGKCPQLKISKENLKEGFWPK